MAAPGMVSIDSVITNQGGFQRRVCGLGTDNRVYLWNRTSHDWELFYNNLATPGVFLAGQGNVPIIEITVSGFATDGAEFLEVFGLGKLDNKIYKWDESTGTWSLYQ